MPARSRWRFNGDSRSDWASGSAAASPGRCSGPGWRANPEFRDERGFEIALHGNWVAIDIAERAMLAQALHTSLGGSTVPHPLLTGLANAGQIALAIHWGLAIRLGQRFSGGLAGPLQRASLGLKSGQVALTLSANDRPLYAETVERRHAALAVALKRKPAVVVAG